MRIKKMLALVLCFAFFCGMFALPLQAATPEERVEVLISGEYHDFYLFDSQREIYWVEDENGIGLYSPSLGWITECQWGWLSETEFDGFYLIYGENGAGVIDAMGNMIIEPEWDMLYCDSGVVIVWENGFGGILDINGNVLHEPSLDGIESFHEGFAKFYKDEKCGFLNTSGRIISEAIWDDAQEFSDSYAAVKNDKGLWGYINTLGEVVIPCQYENVSSFKNGFASILEDDTVYIINKNNQKVYADGKLIEFEPVIDCMGYVEEIEFFGAEKDIACVMLKGEEKYCYIDNSYNLLTDSSFTYDVEFNRNDYCITIMPNRYGMDKYALLVADRTNGVAINTVLEGKNYITDVDFMGNYFFEAESRLYDITGKDLFGMEFEKYIYHYDGSDIINAVYKGQYVCVSFSGEVISPLSDYQFYYVADNLYMATADDGRVKLCDREGKQFANTDEYSEAYYENGYVYVKNDDGKWGLCDTDCNMLIEPEYDALYNVSEGMLKYKAKGKYGFINMETGDVIKAEYSNVADFNEGYCWVSEDVLIGTIDKNGEYIIDPLYWGFNDCSGFGANRFFYGVTSLQKNKNGKYGVVNEKGQKILDFSYDFIGEFSDTGVALFDNYTDDAHIMGLMRVVHNDSEILPTKITTDKNDGVNIYVGCYDVITETVTPNNAVDLGVTFASANEDVAVVDEVGRVYGVSEGNTVIVIVSKATTSVLAVVSVNVEDRTLHAPEDIIPVEDWEEQNWLSDIVIERLGEMGISKTQKELTYGDLLEVNNINITEMEDPGEGIVYHIPAIIGEFSNLITFNIRPEIFAPLISTKPDSTKFLSNLYYWNVSNTYGDEVDENYIRNNESGIPDKNLYKALSYDYMYGKCVTKNSYKRNLSYKGISDLTGLSLLNGLDGELDLSCNNITDISELAKIDFTYGAIDLSYNQLDLTDEETLAVIEALQEKGCAVITTGQNAPCIRYLNEPAYFNLDIANQTSQSHSFYIHNCDISDIAIASTNTDVATAYIEKGTDGYYNLVCKAVGIGTAELYFMLKETGLSPLYWCGVSVIDPRFWAEDIEVSYYVNEWEPTYARINCYNDYSFFEYRLQGTDEWETYSYENRITQNGTYEVRYCNIYGLYSNIATLEITEIREYLTKEQMPDENLRNCFSGGNVYEGYKVNGLYLSYRNISNLKGLSLLDFSECGYWIELQYNYITDISELAKLDISDKNIDLRYNRIDFTTPANSAALRTLYQKGCTVSISNQFYDEMYISAWDANLTPGTDGGIYGYGNNVNVYNADINDISLVLRGGNVISNFSYNYYGSCINYYFDYSSVCGTEYIDIYYKGELFKTVTITVEAENSSNNFECDVYCGGYSEWYGFNISHDFWNATYEYRKQGDAEWTIDSNDWQSNFFYITEAGTYEFRALIDGVYSEITTIELKATVYNGLKMYLKDGGWVIYGTDVTDEVNVVIPETVEGYPVKSIGAGTLGNFMDMESLTISKTIEEIYDFEGNNQLTSIIIDEENPYYYSDNNCVISKSDKKLVTFLPSLTVLDIPEGVETIEYTDLNRNITELNIPSSVEYFDSYNGFYSLEKITVAEDNMHYYVEDDILYEKYTGTLIFCSRGKTGNLTIPEGVLFIGHNAFGGTELTEIKLPASLIEINSSAMNYWALEKLFIPPSVVKIYEFAINSAATIYCVEGSEAHEYAVNNGNEYVLVSLGDANGDGSINVSDIAEIRKLILGGMEFGEIENLLYDVSGDGEIDARDIVRLKKYVAGLDVPLGNEENASDEIITEVAYLDEKMQ